MTTMLQRIRELSQFDVEKPTIEDTEFLTACYPEFKKDPIQESIAGLNGFLHGFKSGRDSENDRLLPLIESLIEALEVADVGLENAVDFMLKRGTHSFECANQEDGEECFCSFGAEFNHVLNIRASMQSILEKAVK